MSDSVSPVALAPADEPTGPVVTATSSDGLSTTDTFDYTVLPNNRFTVSTIKHSSAGTISLRLGLPGAGKVKVVELAPHGVTFGRYAVSVAAKRTLHVKVKPTPAGKALLKKGTTAKIKLEVTYTPKGGVARTLTKGAIPVTPAAGRASGRSARRGS